MDILSPNHAHFGLSDNGVNYGVVNGDNAFITNEIVIGERNSYYVFIGGVELTKQLCEDQDALIELLIESDEQLMEDFFEGISEIYYIPEAKTLHMKNFRMNFQTMRESRTAASSVEPIVTACWTSILKLRAIAR